MNISDYIVFYTYLVMIVSMGLLMRRKQSSEKEFFFAGNSLGWFPLGISIMITMLTAVNFAGFPTEIMTHSCYVLICLPVFALVIIPISKYFIPFFQGQNKSSAYAFLEDVFDTKTRCLASILFMFWRIVWMAVALYTSSRILSSITGVQLWNLILICGSVTVIYTAFGGLRTVIWTDVAQFFVLCGGIIASITLVSLTFEGGITGIFVSAFKHGVIKPIIPFDPEFFSFDPSIRITFWSGVIGSSVAFLTRYGADQMVIQRYFAAKSLSASRKSFILNIICIVSILILLTIFGMTAHAYTVHLHKLGDFKNPMRYLALLIKSLPFGATGLVAAGLLAATMSSIDSGVNACSMAWTKDFYHRFFNKSEEKRSFHIRYSVYFSLLIGILIIILSESFIFIFTKHQSIFAIVNKVINGFGSPLLAVVVLGMQKRWRIKADSVFWGVLIGAIFSIFTVLYVKNLALHYYAALNLFVTFGICFLLDFFYFQKKCK
jgi:SSS family transporter